jgi:DNA-directed RNA polymerase subunit beta'
VHEAHRAYESRTVNLQAKVRVRLREYAKDASGELQPKTRHVQTTVGRALLSEILPHGLSFDLINQDMTKKQISGIINACYRALGLKETVIFADQLMYMGFHYATRSGLVRHR